eukprot:jgi/Galph1/622/GphlegSOOS_G5400.1
MVLIIGTFSLLTYNKHRQNLRGALEGIEKVYQLHHHLNAIANQASQEEIEGNSADSPLQTKWYYLLAKFFTQTQNPIICEIGFNCGHAAVTWLSALPNATYIGFDNGQHSYTKQCEKYLKQQFSDQKITIYYGPSHQTVWDFGNRFPQVSCDLFHIDGGHYGENPFQDVANARRLLQSSSLVVMDDVVLQGPCEREGSFCHNPTQAWKRLNESMIFQTADCIPLELPWRGFCYGIVSSQK